MSQLRNYRIATLALPLVAVIASAVVIGTQVTRLRALENQKVIADKNLGFLEDLIRQDQAQPLGDKVPAIPNNPDEQELFLNELRQRAGASHVQVIRWANTSAKRAKDKDKNKKLSDITPIASAIEVAGEYSKVRSFMYSLLRSSRLLNVSDLTWQRGSQYPTTRLMFTLTRYVTKPQAITTGVTASRAGTTPTVEVNR
ncbi:MAG: hypothetical protein ACR2HJ_01590 [Fimbriimonadales bacterium]